MKKQPTIVAGRIKLRRFAADYCAGLDKKKPQARTDAHGRRIGDLQPQLYANAHHAVLLIFQG